jgi:hypothetical protein
MLFQLTAVGRDVPQTLCADNELYLLQFLQQVFCVGVGSHAAHCSLLIVCAVQLSALHEDADDAGDLLFGDCEVKGSAAIYIFGASVGSELLQEELCEVGMALAGCPVQCSHAEIVHIEGEVGVGLEQSFGFLLS